MIELRSEITGVVVDILAPEGAEIAEGDMVLLLEAMKMEIPALAPCAGRVVELRVAGGDVVEQDQVLAVIHPAAR